MHQNNSNNFQALSTHYSEAEFSLSVMACLSKENYDWFMLQNVKNTALLFEKFYYNFLLSWKIKKVCFLCVKINLVGDFDAISSFLHKSLLSVYPKQYLFSHLLSYIAKNILILIWNRSDIIRWETFNETHLFMPDDFENVHLLSPIDSHDIMVRLCRFIIVLLL